MYVFLFATDCPSFKVANLEITDRIPQAWWRGGGQNMFIHEYVEHRYSIHIYSLIKAFSLFTILIKMYSPRAIKGIFLKISFSLFFKAQRIKASVVLMVR